MFVLLHKCDAVEGSVAVEMFCVAAGMCKCVADGMFAVLEEKKSCYCVYIVLSFGRRILICLDVDILCCCECVTVGMLWCCT